MMAIRRQITEVIDEVAARRTAAERYESYKRPSQQRRIDEKVCGKEGNKY
jgi:hypothetical protein